MTTPQPTTAGRELDARVAEALGDHLVAFVPGLNDWTYCREDDVSVVGPVPHFSTDAAAAMTLLGSSGEIEWGDGEVAVTLDTDEDGGPAVGGGWARKRYRAFAPVLNDDVPAAVAFAIALAFVGARGAVTRG